MSTLGRSFTGAAGTVEEVIFTEGLDDWRMQCSIGTWLCTCPGQSPAWSQYILTMVHLRDVEGQDSPPKKRTPDASHEITVFALDPRGPEVTPQNAYLLAGRRMLRPLNVSIQLEDLTDDQARELLTLCAQGIAHGVLPAEPPLANPMHERTWVASLDATIEHIKLGGHPKAEA